MSPTAACLCAWQEDGTHHAAAGGQPEAGGPEGQRLREQLVGLQVWKAEELGVSVSEKLH